MRHFLSFDDLSRAELESLLSRAAELKSWNKLGRVHKPLEGKTLGMIFEKSSTRTRVSFEVGMNQLGGHAIFLTQQHSQLGRGETYEDTARVLSRYVDVIMMRTFEQSKLEAYAAASSVPVINGLTDLLHPCQLLADLLTVKENFDSIEKSGVVWLGDGNNMAHSWIEAALKLNFPLTVSCPKEYAVDPIFAEKASKSRNVRFVTDPEEACKGAHVLNADTWISMGQEGPEELRKKKTLMAYQLNRKLLKLADSKAILLHCLPAHREEEITSEVMDGPQSRIWDQAENRLHAQKALLEFLMSSKNRRE